MSTQTYIVTGKTRAVLEQLLADIAPITEAPSLSSRFIPKVTVPATPPAEETPQAISPVLDPAIRNRMWAMRDYPSPPEGLVKILTAAIVSWETEAASTHTDVEAATAFRACAWELRQILRDFPEQREGRQHQ